MFKLILIILLDIIRGNYLYQYNDNNISFSFFEGDNLPYEFIKFSNKHNIDIHSKYLILKSTITCIQAKFNLPLIIVSTPITEDLDLDLFFVHLCNQRKFEGENCDSIKVNLLLGVLNIAHDYLLSIFHQTATFSVLSENHLFTIALNRYRDATLMSELVENKDKIPNFLFFLNRIDFDFSTIIEIGSGIGWDTLHLSLLNPNGKIISYDSRIEYFSYFKNNILRNNRNNIIHSNFISNVHLNSRIFSCIESHSSSSFMSDKWTNLNEDYNLSLIKINIQLLYTFKSKAPSLIQQIYHSCLSHLTLFPYFVLKFSTDDELADIDILVSELQFLNHKLNYTLLWLPFNNQIDVIAIPFSKTPNYFEKYKHFIITIENIERVPNIFLDKPLFPDVIKNIIIDQPLFILCNSVFDCRNELYVNSRRIIFISNQLNERGSSMAEFSYAYYLDKFRLVETPIYISFRESSIFPSEISAINKFEYQFGENNVFQLSDDQSGLDNFILASNITNAYHLTGDCSEETHCPGISLYSPTFQRCLIHCIFRSKIEEKPLFQNNLREFAKVSTSIPGSYPNVILPHIVNDTANIHGPDFREDLSIPENATVFCRYGGFFSFDILFVKEVIFEIAKEYRNKTSLYFLFMNTERFIVEDENNGNIHDETQAKRTKFGATVFNNLDNVIFLPGSVNEDYKTSFVRTCDSMIHASIAGETFGLSIAEFSHLNRPIITSIAHILKGEASSHIDMLYNKGIYYWDANSLYTTLIRFHNEHRYKRNIRKDWNAYQQFSPQRVMRIFENIYFNIN